MSWGKPFLRRSHFRSKACAIGFWDLGLSGKVEIEVEVGRIRMKIACGFWPIFDVGSGKLRSLCFRCVSAAYSLLSDSTPWPLALSLSPLDL